MEKMCLMTITINKTFDNLGDGNYLCCCNISVVPNKAQQAQTLWSCEIEAQLQLLIASTQDPDGQYKQG